MNKIAALLVAVALAASGCRSSDTRQVVAEFADVGDLVGRANVQQSDAVIGTVRSIKLIERDGRWLASVTMRVDPETIVQEGTKAVVRATSLLGEKYVDLIPPASSAPELPDGAVIGVSATSKAPDLEAVFSELGALLQSGGLTDIASIATASAAILEGQEENLGSVLDGTAKLLASLASQKEAIASGIADLASAAKTLGARKDSLGRALDVGADAFAIIASQQKALDDLLIQLDRLGGPLADLTRAHGKDIDAQVKALNKVVPKLYEARASLEDAVKKLPEFTKLFAASAPGDYFQLDIHLQSLPAGTPTSLAAMTSWHDVLMEAAE